MADNKDRRTNMAHSSVNAPAKKDGAGGSYVWGSATDVTDYESKGVEVNKVEVEKEDAPTLPATGGGAEPYVHDDAAFPQLGGKSPSKSPSKSPKSPSARPAGGSYASVADKAKAVQAPAQELIPEERKAKLKEVRKEGGKVGIDLEGASNLGNTMFFCAPVAQPGGDLELTVESVKAMNAAAPKVVRAHMERSGCSGNLAKLIVSSNKDQIAVVTYVPKALQEQLAPLDWLQELMEWYGGEIEEKGEEMCTGLVANLAGNGVGYEALLRHHATDVLQKKKLMAQSDHAHDGDDEVFGDDDLPGLSDARKKSIHAARQSIMSMRA